MHFRHLNSCFPLTSFPGKHAHLDPLKATTHPLAFDGEEIIANSKIWVLLNGVINSSLLIC
ncbi:hypothetical protein AtEden1_Chr1g0046971 [Arabidopsis thaliana]